MHLPAVVDGSEIGAGCLFTACTLWLLTFPENRCKRTVWRAEVLQMVACLTNPERGGSSGVASR